MNDVTEELETEYPLVEKQVRDKYEDFFDGLQQELLERWTAVWAEHGFDATKVRVSVSPRIRVSLVDEDVLGKEQRPEHSLQPLYPTDDK